LRKVKQILFASLGKFKIYKKKKLMPPIMPINLMEDALQAEENLTTTNIPQHIKLPGTKVK
jgi:hypothetical protein